MVAEPIDPFTRLSCPTCPECGSIMVWRPADNRNVCTNCMPIDGAIIRSLGGAELRRAAATCRHCHWGDVPAGYYPRVALTDCTCPCHVPDPK